MDTSLTLSMLFGTIGMGFLIYGKKSALLVPMGTGLALMVCPYLIPNIPALLVVCLTLTALPFLLRNA